MWLPLPHSFLRSSRCSSWRVSLFCSPRSVIPQSWLHLPPKTPLRYSLTLIIFIVGVSHHLEFCSPAVARAVMVCHIFCSSLFMLAFSRVHLFVPHIHTAIANPTQELLFILSFRFNRSFHSRHFYFSTLQIHVLTAWLHYIQLSLSTPHKNALPFIHFFLLHSLITSSPCLFQRNCSNKKMCQTSCRQHPAKALRAILVWGTHSTRSGSPTTHRLKTSFCYTSFRF